MAMACVPGMFCTSNTDFLDDTNNGKFFFFFTFDKSTFGGTLKYICGSKWPAASGSMIICGRGTLPKSNFRSAKTQGEGRVSMLCRVFFSG